MYKYNNETILPAPLRKHVEGLTPASISWKGIVLTKAQKSLILEGTYAITNAVTAPPANGYQRHWKEVIINHNGKEFSKLSSEADTTPVLRLKAFNDVLAKGFAQPAQIGVQKYLDAGGASAATVVFFHMIEGDFPPGTYDVTINFRKVTTVDSDSTVFKTDIGLGFITNEAVPPYYVKSQVATKYAQTEIDFGLVTACAIYSTGITAKVVKIEVNGVALSDVELEWVKRIWNEMNDVTKVWSDTARADDIAIFFGTTPKHVKVHLNAVADVDLVSLTCVPSEAFEEYEDDDDDDDDDFAEGEEGYESYADGQSYDDTYEYTG